MWYGVARSNGCTFTAQGDSAAAVETALKEMTDKVELVVIARVNETEDFIIRSTGIIVPQA